MDSQLDARVPFSIDVVIYCRGLGLVRGRTMEVGVRSMILDTGIIRLPIDEDVEVAFVLGDVPDEQVHQVTAQVFSNSELGSELRFRDFEPSTIRSLRRLLSVPGLAKVGRKTRFDLPTALS
jgi:hypothetical protein